MKFRLQFKEQFYKHKHDNCLYRIIDANEKNDVFIIEQINENGCISAVASGALITYNYIHWKSIKLFQQKDEALKDFKGNSVEKTIEKQIIIPRSSRKK